MIQSLEQLRLLPVWVHPEFLASTALFVLRGHRLPQVPVVEGAELLGVVTLDALLVAAQGARVRDVMIDPPIVLDVHTRVKRAAAAFVESGIEAIPVLREGAFCGVLTPIMLLQEMGRSYDPLTNLNWSDTLREWGMESLKQGREISILFLDIDDFGNYNKQYGHIVGDQVLVAIAGLLRDRVDANSDVLVRFGGDEFAIGSVRAREEVEDLLFELRGALDHVHLEGVDGAVEVSIGQSGGKRTKERENVHFAATVDALINLASKECLAAKARRKAGESEDPLASAATGEELAVFAVEADAAAPTIVVLSVDGQRRAGIHLGEEDPALRVAMATAKAIERADLGASMTIDDVVLATDGSQVTVVGRVRRGETERAVVGSESAGSDRFRAIAEATVVAFRSARNRR
ncbi:MAG TPA: diguanylate cyclase [Fimbriimonadaceae bacterium]|nr:diguanylate cyclase [Fimbriimonadaceae bacterium]